MAISKQTFHARRAFGYCVGQDQLTGGAPSCARFAMGGSRTVHRTEWARECRRHRCPPLQRTEGRGTCICFIGEEETKGGHPPSQGHQHASSRRHPEVCWIHLPRSSGKTSVF